MTQKMTRRDPLTRRQQACLDAISAYIEAHGYPPSNRELAEAMGLSAHSAISALLCTLRAKGYVAWEEGKFRTLHVIKETP